MNHQSSKENCVQFIIVLRFHYLQLEVRHKKKEIAELSALSLSLSLASAIDAATASPPRAAHLIPPYHNHQTPQVSTSLSFPNSLKNLSFLFC